MRFQVTYRSVEASRQTGPSADVSAGDEFTEEIDADDAVTAAKMILEQPGRSSGGINILSVQPIDDRSEASTSRS